MLLQIEQISKRFGSRDVLHDINIHLAAQETVAIVGVSGTGKTTLFNLVAGLDQPDTGRVLLNDIDITNTTGHVGYMFQKDLLLPTATIVDNVALPLRLKGMSKRAAREQASPAFARFGLDGTQHLYPAALSGGMKQRAALLRTYFMHKPLMLLDEPFSALDAITKRDLHLWYQQMREELKLSTLLITHDIDEAILLADRIYLVGNAPTTVLDELVVDRGNTSLAEFELTPTFAATKRQILQGLAML